MRRLLPWLALAAYVLHASAFAGWLVDDAGISLAYGRNLGLGEGLRSQPGAPAVEGFSNPLWTLLLVFPSLLKDGARLLALKLLSVSIVAASFWMIACCRVAQGRPDGAAGLSLLLIALNPSFVIWTTSGLENPLFVLLGVASVLLVERAAAGGASPSLSAWAGFVAASLALTRPDGLAYAPAFPLGLAFHALRSGVWAVRTVAAFFSTLAAVLGGYLAFRWSYFGDFVANTTHAKLVSSLADHDPRRLVELLSSLAGPLAFPLVVGIVAAVAFSTWKNMLTSRSASLSLHLALAGAAFVILPPDWMAEFRFATLFVVFFWWLVFGLWQEPVWETLRARLGATPALALGLLAIVTLFSVTTRSRSFAENPTVPLDRISEFGRAYETLAQRIPEASLLTPDLGGVLLTAKRLRVHDLAGLCDREVARTLMRDTRAFHAYVFERLRPTFIHAHGTWAETAAFHADPRFARDYAPLHEVWNRPDAEGPVSGEEPAEPWSGDYVRRTAAPALADLLRLRSEFRRLGLTAPLP